MWGARFAGVAFWCFVVGSIVLYPLSCRCKSKDVWPEYSRVRSLQRCIHKDAYTSIMADLTVPWRSICFLVVPNCLRCTETANDDTRIGIYYCGIPPSNLSAIPECLRNVHHLYQFPDCLVAVALSMPLEASRLPLAMISRMKRSWGALWCGTMPLSEHYLLYLFKWYILIIVSGGWKASLWAIDGRTHLMYLYSDI